MRWEQQHQYNSFQQTQRYISFNVFEMLAISSWFLLWLLKVFANPRGREWILLSPRKLFKRDGLVQLDEDSGLKLTKFRA